MEASKHFNDNLQEIIKCERGRNFVELSTETSNNCRTCEYVSICRGGCRRHYEPIESGTLGENYFYSAYKGFYKYSLNRFYHVARIVSSNWSNS